MYAILLLGVLRGKVLPESCQPGRPVVVMGPVYHTHAHTNTNTHAQAHTHTRTQYNIIII